MKTNRIRTGIASRLPLILACNPLAGLDPGHFFERLAD